MITIKDKSKEHRLHNCKICREEGHTQAIKKVLRIIDKHFSNDLPWKSMLMEELKAQIGSAK